MTNSLAPLEEPYPDDIAKILAKYPQQDGYILKIFRVFANSVRFLTKGMPNLLDKASPLPLRLREIVILRVTANKGCQYEWGVHVAIFASHAGLTDKEVADTTRRELQSDGWSDDERTLIAAIDQLCDYGKIEDQYLSGFRSVFSKEQQLEIFALAGAYHTVSFVANNAELEDEPFGAKFPSD